jgi:hypothetical protein
MTTTNDGANDPINNPISPNHYRSTIDGVDLIDVIDHLSFPRGNAIKYIYRAGKKDPSKEKEDLQKALFLIQREIIKLNASASHNSETHGGN